MRNRRKAYLITHKATGSTMAFDELGEVDDPIKLICEWASENLDAAEIQNLIAELGKISEFGQDDDLLAGVRPARRVAGHGNGAQDSAMRGDFDALFGPSPPVEHNFRTEARGVAENAGDFDTVFADVIRGAR